MSIHALSWVLKHSEAQRGSRLVLLVLASYAGEDGFYAWPSVATLAHETQMTRRSVQAGLRSLEQMGFIERQGESKSGTTIWRIVMELPRGVVTSSGGVVSDSQGAKFATSNGAETTPEPSIEPSGEPSERTRAARAGSSRRILKPEEEPSGFAQWLGQHVAICERWGVARSVPRAGTSARSDLARMFAALLEEGYRLEDFETVSEVVLASDFNRENDHTKFSTVLRKSKFGERIDDGWKAREAASVAQAQGERLGQYDGLVSN